MQSRASFFDRGLFRKAMSRFAPLWGGYTLCLLLGTLLLLEGNPGRWFAGNLIALIQAMPVINLAYGLLSAQLLFGDLCNTRLCYGLHAMPQRRECRFLTHILAGLLFSLIPTAIMAAVDLPVLALTSDTINGWQISLWLWLAVNGQYLFFFSLGVVCMFCSGSRIGAAVIYAIVNFLSYLVFFLADQIYAPLLYGVVLTDQIFQLLCPVVHLTDLAPLTARRHSEGTGKLNEAGEEIRRTWATFEVNAGEWSYYGILLLGAIVLLGLGLWLYRRRRLECAGDMMASKKLEPPFMVVFSIAAAVLFHLVSSLFLGSSGVRLGFLLAGAVAGWFVGRMLIQRQIQVFRSRKNWLWLGALLGTMAVSIFLTSLDPLGIEGRIPRQEEIRRYSVSLWHYGSQYTGMERLDEVLDLHARVLADGVTEEEVAQAEASAYTVQELETATQVTRVSAYDQYIHVFFEYQLENGWVIQREYPIWIDSEAGEQLKSLLNSLESVMDYAVTSEEELMALVGNTQFVCVDGLELPASATTDEAMADLFRAILADCQAQTLTQNYYFHQDTGYLIGNEENGIRTLGISFYPKDRDTGISLSLYADSENCVKWLETYGILDMLYEEYHLVEKFG